MIYDPTNCTLCPRACGTDRTQRPGVCGCGDTVRLAKVMEHYWEEPCLAPEGKPSGAVFFSGCPMKCVYCQNAAISRGLKGHDVTVGKLASIFTDIVSNGAANIDLVTPTHFTPHIARAFGISGKPPVPVIFNTSGYETVQNVALAREFSDIWLCDMRYADAEAAKKYSGAADYPVYARSSLKTAVKAFGAPRFDGKLLKSGVIVRVLVLPRRVLEAKAIISYLAEEYGKDIIISVMGQYTPVSCDLPDGLSRRLTPREYEAVVDFAAGKDICAYMQEKGSDDDCFIPDWNDPGFDI